MTPAQEAKLLDEKWKQLLFALEEIEGRVLSMQEVVHLGVLERHIKEGRPREEIVKWRGNYILFFKWNTKGEMKSLKLYGNTTSQD